MLEHIVVERRMQLPIETVWERVVDIEAYPSFMRDVISVTVSSNDETGRIAEWAIRLRGSILKWRERGIIDPVARVIRFEQVDGDLDVFQGAWFVESKPDGVVARLEASFQIGIPLLATMLTPIAVRTFRDNAEAMLRDLDGDGTAGKETVSTS